MQDNPQPTVADAKMAAVQVLRNNANGNYQGLPRTAGWGYPEPYTRDLMISMPGFLLSRDPVCEDQMRRTLECLAHNQTALGHIPSLVHDPGDRGASDTTPLFLFGLAIFRRHVGEPLFLDAAAQKAMTWMRYQSPDDLVMVGQLPTSDWRDEHWVVGYGLYVNAICYTYLRQYGRHDEANLLRQLMNRFELTAPQTGRKAHEGLALPQRPYYAMCSYKIHHDERFDLLGNSLAILAGVASRSRAQRLINWVEAECEQLRANGELALGLPPCLFPYMRPGDADWRPRYAQFNLPGEYHNGGVWPFICGFYVAACVAAGRFDLAQRNLQALVCLVKPWHENQAEWGFNEQFNALTGKPAGRDWQTWSAAMFLYAARCVETKSTPWFDEVRAAQASALSK
ncbi:MAG TPA: glycoside hydrolase 100 family protein [Polyangiaceae bacterium]|jgi:hypothetical protein|nr:glycoside hydrolase 100 family protein [Polyangiaceae bacterium]